MLSTWELFRDELDRNISPNLEMIEQQLLFLVERNICSEADFSKITKVRLMASHEQAISEYLHNRGIFRQASLKAETVYLASIIEFLLSKILKYFEDRKIISRDNIIRIIPQYPKRKTFDQLIKTAKHFPQFSDKLRFSLNELREERNRVHIDAICPNDTALFNEENLVLKFRKLFDDFISYIRENAHN